jgi:hypothetical protein
MITDHSTTRDVKADLDTMSKILTMLLPLIGAWVGTVIAFYFSKENFQAASEHATKLVQQMSSGNKLSNNIPAVSIMQFMKDPLTIKYKLTSNDPTSDTEFTNLKLKSGLLENEKYLKSNRVNRLPVINQDGEIVYIIHQSMITDFLASQSAQADILTVADLLKNDTNNVASRFATAAIEDNLSTVKSLLDKDSSCKDVFITIDGSRKTPAVGWITNVRLEENMSI